MNRAKLIGVGVLLLLVAFPTVTIVTSPDDRARPTASFQDFLGPDDLEQFAGIANRARDQGDWEALRSSMLAGSHETCTPDQLAHLLAAEQAAAARTMEKRLLADVPGHSYFVVPPDSEWRFSGAEVSSEGAAVRRALFAFGALVWPLISEEEEWTTAAGSWWLLVPDLAARCRSVPVAGDAGDDRSGPLALDTNSFRRPARAGVALTVKEAGGSTLRLTLLRAVRGEGLPIDAPPRPGFDNVYVEVRVETTDGSRLTAPIAFRPASFDGLYYHAGVQRSLRTCRIMETETLSCQLFEGLVQVAANDPAPRLAWVPTPPQDRPEGRLWWWLPGIEEADGLGAQGP